MLNIAVGHPLSRLCPIDVGVVARHDYLLLESGQIGKLHQLGLLAGRIIVAMAVATLTIALGWREDRIGIMGGGVGRLGIIARIVDGEE
jgi:hypothetical protein